MRPIISVINNKGGTAKTTTVINTGEALSRLGKRVLIIDMDNQCNATDILQDGIGRPIVKSLYDILDPRSSDEVHRYRKLHIPSRQEWAAFYTQYS